MSARLLRFLPLAALAFLVPDPAAAAPAPPELPDQIAASWRTDHVFVYPAMRSTFPPAELDRIRAAIRTVNFPVYVALLPRTPGTQVGSADLPTLLQARVGQPGLYLVWTVADDYWSGQELLLRPGGLKGRDLSGVRADDKQDNELVDSRPAPGIVRIIQQAATAYDDRPLPAVPAGDLTPERTRSGRSVTDNEDLSAFIGMGAGALISFVLVIGLTLRHRRKKPTKRPAGKTSPATVTSIRLQADRWIAKAQRSQRSLESRIKASRSKAALPDLLDHRDNAAERLSAARTLRSTEPEDLAAMAGAFVLARQAYQAATGAAVLPPCFFDPTHQSGTVQAGWSDGTEVPACPACAKLLDRGETPPGFRLWKKTGLFRLDQAAVPYWTLDPSENPLLATGFGALEDDLVERVNGNHR